MMISVSMFSQTRTITGKVTTSDTGEPVIGATITVKGTNAGTISDAEGTFLLRVNQNEGTLMASFVGMKSIEVPLTSSNVYNFTWNQKPLALTRLSLLQWVSQEKRKHWAIRFRM